MWESEWKPADKDQVEKLESSIKEANILTKLIAAADIDSIIKTRVDRIRRKRYFAIHSMRNNTEDVPSSDVWEAIKVNKIHN